VYEIIVIGTQLITFTAPTTRRTHTNYSWPPSKQ